MAGSFKRDKRRAVAAERQRKALDLRLRGATFDQVAQALGYSHRSNARQDIEKALQSLEKECAESANRVRQKELLKLDMMELGLSQKMYKGDTQAVASGLRIQERRASLLGLDQPKGLKIEVDRELEAFLARLREGLDPDAFERVLAVATGSAGVASEAGTREDPDEEGGDGEGGEDGGGSSGDG